MGKMQREKGNAFERLIAKEVIKAFEPLGMTKKDCYRTPMSGGHPSAQRGDLVISERLRPYFRFTIECKHQRDWNPGVMVASRLRAKERGWINQAQRAAKVEECLPILVTSGNGTGIFVSGPHVEMIREFPELKGMRPSVRFRAFKNEAWTMWEWSAFWQQLHERAKYEAKKLEMGALISGRKAV